MQYLASAGRLDYTNESKYVEAQRPHPPRIE